MTTTTLEVEHLFSITAKTDDHEPVMIADGSGDATLIVTVMSGTFSGEHLNGVVADVAGGDWLRIRPDGTIELDVRVVLRTDEGEHVYLTYTGLGRGTDDGTLSIRVAARFRTASPRLAWLNGVQAVGLGVAGDGWVTYEMYILR